MLHGFRDRPPLLICGPLAAWKNVRSVKVKMAQAVVKFAHRKQCTVLLERSFTRHYPELAATCHVITVRIVVARGVYFPFL